MLPTMIQMGICQSSCLEISNMICKGRRDTREQEISILGPGWRLGPGLEHRKPLAPGGELHRLP